MESNGSLFEEMRQKAACIPLRSFRAEEGIHPLTFQDSRLELPLQSSDALGNELGQLKLKHQGKVLEGLPSSTQCEGKRIGVLFSGGPAPGGHNVLLGIYAALGGKNTLLGIKSGPKGLLTGDLFDVTASQLATVQNLGGFDFLGSDRTKIKTPEQFEKVKETVHVAKLDGLIIIGGDDSNTNAALLAEYLLEENCTVVGVPKTIDGDLQAGTLLPISFGFDTATKIYAELVGNILQDTPSSQKYWHFIKLMGRSASHVTLEVGLQTKPAVTLISEEILEKRQSLDEIVTNIAKTVTIRASQGINHGVVLVPEGLVEFIPEMKTLIQELNAALPRLEAEKEGLSSIQKYEEIKSYLSESVLSVFNALPYHFAEKLLLDRDAHGNLQVSLIETEKLLAEMVSEKVRSFQEMSDDLSSQGLVLGSGDLGRFLTYSFKSQVHFFGYEGRCGAPTAFDSFFTYNLGIIAGALCLSEKTGYMAAVTDFDKGGRALAVPLTSLIVSEMRHGHAESVIEKALVKTSSPSFSYFESRREEWAHSDCFSSPGPRQYEGASADQLPISVALNQGYASLSYKGAVS
ncbi:diphosphate--fructose-6-phosphate 1-phosphotransferase [Candidatus Marinamargulisbacteria bacterium SCGC AG-439-L15]|nr:diphosphate--fructose-6-phosphate 1-phosphotransferase [Candidatus Marinamargulisbacteria bacterium SCGC AG-439-L15]